MTDFEELKKTELRNVVLKSVRIAMKTQREAPDLMSDEAKRRYLITNYTTSIIRRAVGLNPQRHSEIKGRRDAVDDYLEQALTEQRLVIGSDEKMYQKKAEMFADRIFEILV